MYLGKMIEVTREAPRKYYKKYNFLRKFIYLNNKLGTYNK